LPWGRGFAPKQLSVGEVPAGTRGFCLPRRKHPQEDTCLSAPPGPHKISPLATFPAGSQPVSSLKKKKDSHNKQNRKSGSCALGSLSHNHKITLLSCSRPSQRSFTVGWLGRRPEVTSVWGSVESKTGAAPSCPPSYGKNYFRLIVPETLRRSATLKPPLAAFHLGGGSQGLQKGRDRRERKNRVMVGGKNNAKPTDLCLWGEGLCSTLFTAAPEKVLWGQ
jgi:hypothetical protein